MGGSHNAQPFAFNDRDGIVQQWHVQVPVVGGECRGCKLLATVHWNLLVVPNPPAAPVVRLYDDLEQLTVIWAEPDNGGADTDCY
jgi:hypothetical protein